MVCWKYRLQHLGRSLHAIEAALCTALCSEPSTRRGSVGQALGGWLAIGLAKTRSHAHYTCWLSTTRSLGRFRARTQKARYKLCYSVTLTISLYLLTQPHINQLKSPFIIMNPPKGTKKLTKPPPSPRSTSSSPWVSSCSTSSGVSRTMSFARDRPDSFDLQRFSPTLSTTRPSVLLPPKHTSPDKGMVRSWVSGGGGAVRGRWDEDLIRAKGENEDDSYRVDGWVSEADRYEQRHGRQRLMDEWEYTRRQHQVRRRPPAFRFVQSKLMYHSKHRPPSHPLPHNQHTGSQRLEHKD